MNNINPKTQNEESQNERLFTNREKFQINLRRNIIFKIPKKKENNMKSIELRKKKKRKKKKNARK